jgi:hypothetical protein
LAVFVLAGLTASPAAAADLTEIAKLTPSDGVTGNHFGAAVDATEDTVVVGAPDQNAVYVFAKPAGGWSGSLIEVAKLTATGGAAVNYEHLGASVAISEDGRTIIAGDPNADSVVNGTFDDIGGAIVFFRSPGGWAAGSTQQPLFVDAIGGPVQASDFGRDVAIAPDGSFAAVSSPGWFRGNNTGIGNVNPRNLPQSNGMVAVFGCLECRNGWQTPGYLVTADVTDETPPTFFGTTPEDIGDSLAIVGRDIVAGSFKSDPAGLTSAGVGYVYDEPLAGWSLSQQNTGKPMPFYLPSAALYASDGANNDILGISAAGDDGTLVVGAASDDIVTAGDNRGSAYVFNRPPGGWSGPVTESAKLTASGGQPNDLFGSSAAVDGRSIAVGAHAADGGKGAVYTFDPPPGGTWSGPITSTSRLRASDGAAGDALGGASPGNGDALAMSGAYVFAGAFGPSASTAPPGAAYVFQPGRTLTLVAAGSGAGSVSGSGIGCSDACRSVYPVGAAVPLTATPDAGSVFNGWSGGCTGTGTCAPTLSSDVAVTATFTRKPTLTLSVLGPGAVAGTGIACPGTCSASYAPGSTVTLTATPASGSTFVGWSGGGCSGNGTCDVNLGDGAVDVGAVFAPTDDGGGDGGGGAGGGGGGTVVEPVANAPDTVISRASINPAKHKARFKFRGIGDTQGFECALARGLATEPQFAPCRSAKTYRRLQRGRYRFFVRAVGPEASDPTPATRAVRIG